MMRRFIAALLLAAFSVPAAAENDLSVERAWMRPTATSTGAIYLTIRNGTGKAATLTGVDCPPAHCMMHQSSEQGGVMSMQMLDSLPVPAGGVAVFKPGALHIMVTGLKKSLALGAEFPIILHFDSRPDQPVSVPVRKGAP